MIPVVSAYEHGGCAGCSKKNTNTTENEYSREKCRDVVVHFFRAIERISSTCGAGLPLLNHRGLNLRGLTIAAQTHIHKRWLFRATRAYAELRLPERLGGLYAKPAQRRVGAGEQADARGDDGGEGLVSAGIRGFSPILRW